MEEIKVTIENYQQLAMRTCLPSAKNRTYALENYHAEMFELFAKLKSFHAKKRRDGKAFNEAKYIDKIKDEIGDCFWQLALCCELEKKSFFKMLDIETLGLGGIWVPCDFKIKGIFSHINIEKIYKINIAKELHRIKAVCYDCKFDILDILQRNIDKLQSRKERGVIKGSGDER